MTIYRSPKVACCLLNWNGKDDTLACLHSLKDLVYSAMSVFVVDNGSTDGSVEAFRSCGIPLQLVETGANLGFARGYNVVIREVLQDDFDYVWLLNNDTIVNTGTLTALVAKAEADPGIGAIGSVCYYADSPDRVQVWVGAYVNRWIGFSRNTAVPKPDDWYDSLYGASLLLRKATLDDVGLLDEGYFFSWEETDLCLRIVDAGWRLAGAPESTLLHKYGASTGRTNPLLDRYTTASRLRGIRLYSPAPYLFVPMYALFRLLKKACTLEPERVRQVWAGILDYLRSFRSTNSPANVRRLRRLAHG